LAKRLLDT